jgi:hypothetical protein
MSGKLPGLRKRLAKVERQLASIARDAPRECNCRSATVANPDHPEEFEAEMNRTCPAHGFRRLGWLAVIEHIGRRGDERSAKLDQLLKTYKARRSPDELRLSRLRQVGLKLKHGSQEL